jgi:hypothetical protein
MQPILFILAISVITLTTGCTLNKRVSVKPSPTVSQGVTGGKLPCSAVVVLTPELKSFKSTRHVGLDTEYYLLGEPLTRYVKDVSKAIFSEVKSVDSLAAAPNQGDIVLVPKPVRSDVAIVPGHGVRVLIAVEWLVKDRTGQKTIWLRTVEGDVAEILGFNLGKHIQIGFQRCFDELSSRTLSAIAESQEIRTAISTAK